MISFEQSIYLLHCLLHYFLPLPIARSMIYDKLSSPHLPFYSLHKGDSGVKFIPLVFFFILFF
ncbi:hypothetical protein BGX38DRAFT_1180671 [Terfezia claveryi]|nr:hypothetical protein BGX38DRAFT_1180671 [Terfezia claveryi]